MSQTSSAPARLNGLQTVQQCSIWHKQVELSNKPLLKPANPLEKLVNPFLVVVKVTKTS